MGLFVHEDPYYDPDVRQVGFNRYKQLLSRHAFSWIKLNLLTVLGALPLAAGIGYAILSSSILILIPLSILGGMIWGTFLAGLYDGILRGLRDAPGTWWTSWLKSWRQNTLESLLPGAILGLLIGMYAFMAALFWWSAVPQTLGTLALYSFWRPAPSAQHPLLAPAGSVPPDRFKPDAKHYPVYSQIFSGGWPVSLFCSSLIF